MFLSRKDAAGYPTVMGLQQGKYTIREDESGTKRVRNELGGTTLIGAGGRTLENAKVNADRSLQSFLDGIRSDLGVAGKVQLDPTPQTE